MLKPKLSDQVTLALYAISLFVITAGIFRAYF